VLAFVSAALIAGCPGVFPHPRHHDDESYEATVVMKWNEVALAAVRNGAPRPTVTARSMFIIQCSMYDAWAAYDSKAVGTQLGDSLRRPRSEHTLANKNAAISYAAYRSLRALYPTYEANTGAFTTLLTSLGYEVDYSTDTTVPAGIGNVAAQAVIDARQDDGANESGNYAQMSSATYPTLYAALNAADPAADNAPGGSAFDANHWQPLRVPTGKVVDLQGNAIVDPDDPASYTDQNCLTPHWGAVTPFAMTSGDQFRPAAPPQAGSDEPYTDGLGRTMTNDEAYHMQVDEILQISANLTDREKVIAEYWADGPRSETPPGHWHAIAHGISFRDRHTVDQDVKMYFALAGALFDSSISAWEAKRHYDYIRPQSAIRHKYAGQQVLAWAGPNLGTQQISGDEWRPYQSLTFVTPPFQEYVSGHSTFSSAAAEVLTRFTGSNRFYDGETILPEDFNRDGVSDMLGQHIVGVGGNAFESSPAIVVVLRWETFQDAADEAGVSRRYGGIHFQDGDLRARTMGEAIGEQAYEKAEAMWNGTP
jgi:hypothetical protein